jgi:hypothetical protein
LATRPVPERDCPEYDLEKVCDAVDDDRVDATTPAIEGALAVGLDVSDIPLCLKSLKPDDFYKCQQHEDRDHVWLDIYRPHYRDRDLYVKFHEDTYGRPERFIVRSFKAK